MIASPCALLRETGSGPAVPGACAVRVCDSGTLALSIGMVSPIIRDVKHLQAGVTAREASTWRSGRISILDAIARKKFVIATPVH